MAKQRGNIANLKPIPKGVVMNPGGRPKVDEETKAILKAATPDAARTLVGLLQNRDPKIKLRASEIILDRVYGKATQAVDVQVTDVAKIHLQALQEINQRRSERLKVEGKTPEVIDVTPTTEESFDDLC